MSAGPRLAAFLLALVATFGIGAALGAALGPEPVQTHRPTHVGGDERSVDQRAIVGLSPSGH